MLSGIGLMAATQPTDPSTMSEPSTSPTAAEAGAPPVFWRSVWQAIQGTHSDYTTLPLNRAVLLLAVPMVLEMSMESLFAVAAKEMPMATA
jgi:hypothetical protein